MTDKIQAIPTNLITGFLGSGKTTAILKLLRSRPQHSNWAVLVNEFGDVGIDGAMLEQEGLDDGVFIKEVPGGCICCAAGLPLQIALNLLIKKANPDRILIEPTGVGHPKKVMDTLTGEFYKTVLDIRATICLVEAHKINEDKYRNNETFIDQLNMADVLLASKSDKASQTELDTFYEFSQSFRPVKAHLDAIEFGQFSTDLLDIKRNEQRCAVHPNAHPKKIREHHSHGGSENSTSHSTNTAKSQLEHEDNFQWQKFENNGQGYFGCGWIFDRSIIFNENKLEDFVKDEVFSRVKGIFRTHKGWVLMNRSDDQFSKEGYENSQDSRIEIIESEYHDWNDVEVHLLNCIQ
ncbi:MAG: GTP-binding protein [Gammaproteobacteria bacterium]|nr:GTP-binding protein [Gammaproteobacteria bacterium]